MRSAYRYYSRVDCNGDRSDVVVTNSGELFNIEHKPRDVVVIATRFIDLHPDDFVAEVDKIVGRLKESEAL